MIDPPPSIVSISTPDPDVTQEPGVWIIADPRSPSFGEPYVDADSLAASVRQGPACLVTTCEGVLVLEWALSSEEFLAAYRAKAKASGFEDRLKDLSATQSSEGPRKRRNSGADHLAQLGQLDMFALRPELVRRRLVYQVIGLAGYTYLVIARYYSDQPPSALALLAVTFMYPLMLYGFARLMHLRARPLQRYVFEWLLVFDIYQLMSSVFIFLAVFHEASKLELLNPPWGNPSEVSSPLLRQLMWFHYHNRMIELLDAFIRISQKKFKAYGAVHLYMRLMFLWGWLVVCRVGGGDVYFHILIDSGVTSVRFLVYTLTFLRWNWNISVDFGLHAPKVTIFRKEHLYHLQVAEFVLVGLHALYSFYANAMSWYLVFLQLVVMFIGGSIFTNFHNSRDSTKSSDRSEDSRLTFSFDSSAWLFIYHFGVAQWVQDHVDVTQKDFAFSGSSGGALVAATLACPLDAMAVKDMTLSHFPSCQKNPLLMFHVGEITLDHFLRDTTFHEHCTDHLRVLLTKVSRTPPLLSAEVACKFSTWQELFCCLRGSMHVPLAGGILPYPVPGRGWYYDGLIWASLFVPWRTFDENDEVVRVSACGFPGAQIGPSTPFPIWWLMMPPSAEVLHGMFWMGYRDAQEYFSDESQASAVSISDQQRGRMGCERRSGSAGPPAQVIALRKHLRKNPVDRFDDDVARLVRDLEATAARHWYCFFVGLFVLVASWTVLSCMMSAFRS